MTTCKHCGSTEVIWGKTKAGKPMLMESKPHFIYCKARPKPRPRPGSGASPLVRETREMIEVQWGKARIKELLPFAKGKDIEARYLAVLAHERGEK